MNIALVHGIRDLTSAEILTVSGGMEESGAESDYGGGDYGGGNGGWSANDYGYSTMDGFNQAFNQPPGDYSYSLSMECVRNTAYGIAGGYVGVYSITENGLASIAMGIIGGLGAIGTSCFNDNRDSYSEGSR